MTQSQQPSSVDIRRTAWKIFLLQQVNLQTSLPCAIYIVLLIAQIPSEQALLAMAPIPLFALVAGVMAPLAIVRRLTRQALSVNPGEPEGARLVRILKLPRALEISILAVYLVGNSGYLTWIALRLDRPLYIVPWGSGIIAVMMLLVMIWTRVFLERLLMPHAVEEFRKNPQAPLYGGEGLLWPRQRWYLPYCFALFVLCTVVALGSIVVHMGLDLYAKVTAALPAEALASFSQTVSTSLGAVWIPLALVGLYMLITSACAAYLLTQQQERGFREVQQAIEGFANGSPTMPAWVTTDETGDLARVTARAFNELREFSLSLDRSASKLGSSADQLAQSNTFQNQVLSRQSAALQETQVTAQEIRQTSQVAAQKAESVLEQADAAEQLGRSSEAAIEQSVSSLQQIRDEVAQMATSIKELEAHTQQIGDITETVKDLADQSNLLAVNAAIEAARSGEHGKGFAVVAQEIRSLADQSIRATTNVRRLLEDIQKSISVTVQMTERGAERVSTSVEQVRGFGDNMRQMSSIMKDSSLAVRQISAAVHQQAQGITQIFQAVNDLNSTMDETLKQLGDLSNLTRDVGEVSTEVNTLINRHGWEHMAAVPASPPAHEAK